MNSKEKNRILVVLVFLILLCMSIVAYLTYFEVFRAADIVKRPENRRSVIAKNEIKRGDIYDRNGILLATTTGSKGRYTRKYEYPFLYSHVLGYSGVQVGDYQLEATYRDYLLGKNEVDLINRFKNLINNKDTEKVGNDLYITLDTRLQQKTKEILEATGERGAIVTMNPKTGEVYSMISLPDFNAESIDRDIRAINEQNQGALVNKATMGQYAPGSTFKIVSTAAILESGINLTYEDIGEQEIDGRKFKNADNAVYGKVDLMEAFTKSINTYYVKKIVDVGQKKFGEVADKFMLNQSIDFDIPLVTSKFQHTETLPLTTLAASGIGQGNVITSPLEMCLITSAIANDGKIMKPYIVSRAQNKEGNIAYQVEPKVLSEAIGVDNAHNIREYMIEAVRSGSGKNAQIRGITVAGKSGTAQRNEQSNNAWFVAFAPAENPQIAVSVVIENVMDYGGVLAAPVAKEVMEYAIKELGIGE